jgi:group II intron reverse transcriptase/maturase
MGDTLRSQTVLTKLQRIAEQAVRCPDMIFTTLVHHITVEFLREAYRRSRKDGAPGIDKVTAKEYAENLEENLDDLYERLRSGRYKAPPVERVWIDKENGEKRPIGKATFEDKIVQRAMVMLLSAVYETMFYDFSHGFREGHSQHQALKELWELCRIMNIGWIVDADIRGLFDNLDHKHLREMIQRRINDGGVLRLIGKWLNAGVMEERTLWYPEQGTPQGGVISPLLSNIFLHYALDEWFVKEVQPRIKGRCFLLRFADDFIIGFELEEDARRVMDVLPKRLGRFGLALHPEKTKIVKFRKPKAGKKSDNENGTFDFLGFTHYWARSLKGYWIIKRKTMGKRLRRTIRALWEWCRNNRHTPLLEQYRKLCSKLRGHYQYYGIRCNYQMLEVVFEKAKRAWRYWLSRRSHKGNISWEKFEVIKRKLPLPRPRIVHNI